MSSSPTSVRSCIGRVKDADMANVPGTGLGMHITKRFIEEMGGSVGFESIHGQGTTFYFNLPAENLSPQLASDPPPAQTPLILAPPTQPQVVSPTNT